MNYLCGGIDYELNQSIYGDHEVILKLTAPPGVELNFDVSPKEVTFNIPIHIWRRIREYDGEFDI